MTNNTNRIRRIEREDMLIPILKVSSAGDVIKEYKSIYDATESNKSIERYVIASCLSNGELEVLFSKHGKHKGRYRFKNKNFNFSEWVDEVYDKMTADAIYRQVGRAHLNLVNFNRKQD